jgi:hypothetical protein
MKNDMPWRVSVDKIFTPVNSINTDASVLNHQKNQKTLQILDSNQKGGNRRVSVDKRVDFFFFSYLLWGERMFLLQPILSIS